MAQAMRVSFNLDGVHFEMKQTISGVKTYFRNGIVVEEEWFYQARRAFQTRNGVDMKPIIEQNLDDWDHYLRTHHQARKYYNHN
jgi:hypothetical protein